MKIDFWSSILLFSALLGYFLGVVLLFHKRGIKVSNNLLGILQIIIALLITEYLLFSSGIYASLSLAVFVTTPLIFLIGPLYYLYSYALLSGELKFKAVLLLHFIPFLLCFINYLDYYFSLVSYFSGNKEVSYDFIVRISGYTYMGIEIFQTAVYVITVYMLFNRYQNNLPHNVNGIEKIRTKWLQRLTNVFLIYLAIKSAALIFLLTVNYYVQVEYVLTLSLAAIIYVIGYSSINIPEIFSGVLKNGLAQKYQRSSLSTIQIEDYLERLNTYMKRERPYLKPELKLPDLAEGLSISSNHLSQLFSQKLKTNFFDYINFHRIELAKKMLIDPRKKDFTVLAIAFESGFNSKTSFNRIFKKHTGTTPSEFVKSIPRNQIS